MPKKPDLCHFLEHVIKLLLFCLGRAWQSKFKGQKHVDLSILNKVQLIIAKFVAAASYPDNIVATFRDTPLIFIAASDAASAAKLMKYSIDDLDQAIITTALGIFSKVPKLFTKLFPPATVD